MRNLKIEKAKCKIERLGIFELHFDF